MQVFLVGGAVRDKLLNLNSKDKDWVIVGSSPDEILSKGYIQVGQDFPVFLHPNTQEEYALARTERKQGEGYTGFICDSSDSVTLEEDLIRRDLTINAMAQAKNGTLIDPYGGQKDLDKKLLRHVSAAFTEDPLRVLRVARFAARFKHLGFSIAAETLELMKQITNAGELDHLVAERVCQETTRALGEASPQTFFEVLRKVGALNVLFPEIDALFGIPQPEKHHPEIDCGIHTMMVLEQASKLSENTAIRFACLTHDLGKALSDPANLPHHYGHEKVGLKQIKALCKRFRFPNNFKELALLVCEYHTHIHKALELKPQTCLKVLKQCDAFRRHERFEAILTCAKADSRGRTGFETINYPQADYFLELLKNAQAIQAKHLVKQGYKGQELGEKIDLERLEAIRNTPKPEI
ncbi:MAG: tRNA nucleotidyltransferase (CCA-adding enzyme) [Oleiphilaceae bacterium]|jgi:tRNA nucleotidyltransferase (CCA-adding enzyme)